MKKTLYFNNIVKNFGGTQALGGVSFPVSSGEIVALLGENGAGKSTLIKILADIYQSDSGSITITDENNLGSQDKIYRRIGFIHQDLGLIDWMTVAENVALAHGFSLSAKLGLFNIIDWGATEKTAAQMLKIIGADIDPASRVQDLTRTEKSLVAIARALGTHCEFLVLDEPTVALFSEEVARLFDVLLRLKHQGVGILYITHRLEEVFQIADRVVVLRDGLKVAEKAIHEISRNELVHFIIGKPQREAFPKIKIPIGHPKVVVRDLITPHAGPVNFEIREGELLGFVGLRGSGQEEIGRALFGAINHQGEITIDGVAPDLTSPETALDSGVGLISHDRIVESLADALLIRENAFLNPHATGRKFFSALSPAEEAAKAKDLGHLVALHPNEPEIEIEELSGGNQQKVVLGRWLVTGRKLLVAEDPTAGVDVGAKSEIYKLINQTLASGVAIVVVSTDFAEVAKICHRALVFNQGLIVKELSHGELTVESIAKAASMSIEA